MEWYRSRRYRLWRGLVNSWNCGHSGVSLISWQDVANINLKKYSGAPALGASHALSRLQLIWMNTMAGKTIEELLANLVDVHNHRLALMDEFGIDFVSDASVLWSFPELINAHSDGSLLRTTLRPRGIRSGNSRRNGRGSQQQLSGSYFEQYSAVGAFAALAMHNASVAAQELNRTVKELGFLGALLNDYQQSGPNDGMSPCYPHVARGI